MTRGQRLAPAKSRKAKKKKKKQEKEVKERRQWMQNPEPRQRRDLQGKLLKKRWKNLMLQSFFFFFLFRQRNGQEDFAGKENEKCRSFSLLFLDFPASFGSASVSSKSTCCCLFLSLSPALSRPSSSSSLSFYH